MDAPEGVENVVGAARRYCNDLLVVARVRDARHASRLVQLGAACAIPEAMEGSLQLSKELLLALGQSTDQVERSIQHKRAGHLTAAGARPQSR